jgi:hypothetical protein
MIYWNKFILKYSRCKASHACLTDRSLLQKEDTPLCFNEWSKRFKKYQKNYQLPKIRQGYFQTIRSISLLKKINNSHKLKHLTNIKSKCLW